MSRPQIDGSPTTVPPRAHLHPNRSGPAPRARAARTRNDRRRPRAPTALAVATSSLRRRGLRQLLRARRSSTRGGRVTSARSAPSRGAAAVVERMLVDDVAFALRDGRRFLPARRRRRQLAPGASARGGVARRRSRRAGCGRTRSRRSSRSRSSRATLRLPAGRCAGDDSARDPSRSCMPSPRSTGRRRKFLVRRRPHGEADVVVRLIALGWLRTRRAVSSWRAEKGTARAPRRPLDDASRSCAQLWRNSGASRSRKRPRQPLDTPRRRAVHSALWACHARRGAGDIVARQRRRADLLHIQAAVGATSCERSAALGLRRTSRWEELIDGAWIRRRQATAPSLAVRAPRAAGAGDGRR